MNVTIQQQDSQGRVTVHSDEEYQKYWSLGEAERQEFVRRSFEQRNPLDTYATSRDSHLRELEIASIARYAAGAKTILDLGCGNGHTLLSLAATTSAEMTGVDFAETLIDGARALTEQRRATLTREPKFVCGDAVKYVAGLDDNSIDCVVTERFLQNLPSPEAQKAMIRSISRVLTPSGVLLMCEGSEDGFDALNDIRATMGLTTIPATSPENVTAIRFSDADVENFAAGTGLTLQAKVGYSTYFLISRVLHPLLAAPLAPRFDAPINQYAADIQRHARTWDPGYGSNVLWVYKKG